MTALEVVLITIALICGINTAVLILMSRQLRAALTLGPRVYRLEQNSPHDFSQTVIDSVINRLRGDA